VRRNQALGVHQTLTLTVLQNAKVFAVNDVVDPNQTGDPESSIPAKTISLVVEKEKAKRLVLASELGNIRLTLRSPDDEIEEVNNSLTIEDLLSGRSFTAEPDNDKASGDGLLSLLNSQPANPVPPVDLTPTNEHVMVVIEGADAVREFRFTDGRAVPVESVNQPNLRTLDAAAPADPPDDAIPETPDDDDDDSTDDLDLGFDFGGVET
jgi:Flp pilus assembly protein CpaB